MNQVPPPWGCAPLSHILNHKPQRKPPTSSPQQPPVLNLGNPATHAAPTRTAASNADVFRLEQARLAFSQKVNASAGDAAHSHDDLMIQIGSGLQIGADALEWFAKLPMSGPKATFLGDCITVMEALALHLYELENCVYTPRVLTQMTQFLNDVFSPLYVHRKVEEPVERVFKAIVVDQLFAPGRSKEFVAMVELVLALHRQHTLNLEVPKQGIWQESLSTAGLTRESRSSRQVADQYLQRKQPQLEAAAPAFTSLDWVDGQRQ